jgi:hypothetical protein
LCAGESCGYQTRHCVHSGAILLGIVLKHTHIYMPPTEASNQTQTPFEPAPLRVGKFKASIMIVSQSWKLLKEDKEILWFPVLSMITSLCALVLMGILFFFMVMGGDVNAFEENTEQAIGLMEYLILIAYYTIMFFIVNFFQAGIYIIAHGRMNGMNLSFTDGIRGARSVAGKIFVWSLISATVGVVLRAIAERSKLIGKIVVGLLGAGWNILTYFSLPALVIGNVSVIESFKQSASTIRKTWGETLIVHIGVGLFFGLLTVAGIVLGVGVIMLAPITALVVLVLMALFVLAISVISSALGAIFKLALYEYANTGKIPEGFSPELIQNAVRQEKDVR